MMKVNISRTLVLSRFYFHSSGNQTVLFYFWPIFRNLAPIITGFVAFGKILEQNSGTIPYRQWVTSGLTVWLIMTTIFTTSSSFFSSKTRRARAQLAGIRPYTLVAATNLPNYVISLLVSIYSLSYTFQTFSFREASIRTILQFTYIFLMVQLSIPAVILFSIVVSLARDMKYILIWLSQFLLYISPIFYVSRKPNSTIELIFEKINPLNYFLSIERWICFDAEITIDWQFYVTTLILIVFVLWARFTHMKFVGKFMVISSDTLRDELDE